MLIGLQFDTPYKHQPNRKGTQYDSSNMMYSEPKYLGDNILDKPKKGKQAIDSRICHNNYPSCVPESSSARNVLVAISLRNSRTFPSLLGDSLRVYSAWLACASMISLKKSIGSLISCENCL